MVHESFRSSYCTFKMAPFQQYIPPMSNSVLGPTIPTDTPLIIPVSPLQLVTSNSHVDSESYPDDAELNLPMQEQLAVGVPPSDVSVQSSLPPGSPASPPVDCSNCLVKFSAELPHAPSPEIQRQSRQRGKSKCKTQTDKRETDFQRYLPPHMAEPSGKQHHSDGQTIHSFPRPQIGSPLASSSQVSGKRYLGTQKRGSTLRTGGDGRGRTIVTFKWHDMSKSAIASRSSGGGDKGWGDEKTAAGWGNTSSGVGDTGWGDERTAAGWGNTSDLGTALKPSDGEDEGTSTGRGPTSATTSTTVSLASPALPASTIHSQLDTLLPTFVPTGPPRLPAEPCNWQPSYISRCVLVIKPHDEVRLRYRALQNPSWNIVDAITDAIHRGIPFRLAVNRQDLPFFETPSQQLPCRPECYKPGYRDIPLVYEDAIQFFHDWEQQIRVVLSRPHAYIYLFHGGLLWRLAREYGPPTLFQAASKGLSLSATVWGQQDEVLGPMLITDIANKFELPVLLGHARGSTKSLWPPLECFNDLDCWNGEWNDNTEFWFQRQLSGIKAGAGPKLESEWRRDRRFGRRDAIDHRPNFDTAFTLLSTSPGRTWNNQTIRNILLPEHN